MKLDINQVWYCGARDRLFETDILFMEFVVKDNKGSYHRLIIETEIYNNDYGWTYLGEL